MVTHESRWCVVIVVVIDAMFILDSVSSVRAAQTKLLDDVITRHIVIVLAVFRSEQSCRLALLADQLFPLFTLEETALQIVDTSR